MSKFNRVFAAAVLLAGIPLGAFAQASQNVQVQVQVQGNCTVTAPSNASFGLQGPVASTTLTATGQVTLTCNRGAVPLLAVNNGNNFTTTRRMANGGATAFVDYAVKQPTISGTNNYTVCPAFGAGTVWTAASTLNASAAFAASGGPRTVSVCFETTIDENTVIATYTDTVAVSFSF
jgi:ABC-type proline/glycine betaine transport system permease subunit